MVLRGMLIWMFFRGHYKNAPQGMHLLRPQQTIQKRKIHVEYKCKRKRYAHLRCNTPGKVHLIFLSGSQG